MDAECRCRLSGPAVPASWPSSPACTAVAGRPVMMIVISDNTAANAVIDVVGFPAVVRNSWAAATRVGAG